MRVISVKPLRQFWQKPAYSDSEQPLRSWYQEARHADWKTPADIKAAYRSASLVGNDRVVFNIGGNKYRLIVRVNYAYGVVYVRFIGTHAQYDRINAKEI